MERNLADLLTTAIGVGAVIGAAVVSAFGAIGVVIPILIGSIPIGIRERERRATRDLRAAALQAAARATTDLLQRIVLGEPLIDLELDDPPPQLSLGLLEDRLRRRAVGWTAFEAERKWRELAGDLEEMRQRYLAAVDLEDLTPTAKRAVLATRRSLDRASVATRELIYVAGELWTYEFNGAEAHHRDRARAALERPMRELDAAIGEIRGARAQLNGLARTERQAAIARGSAPDPLGERRDALGIVADFAREVVLRDGARGGWLEHSTLAGTVDPELRSLVATTFEIQDASWDQWNTLASSLTGTGDRFRALTERQRGRLAPRDVTRVDCVLEDLRGASDAAAAIWSRELTIHAPNTQAEAIANNRRERTEARETFGKSLGHAVHAVDDLVRTAQ